jgi:hypothetical protein
VSIRDAQEHLRWAEENEGFVESIQPSTQVAINWAIAILFYAAVHYVDSYFIARGTKPLIHHKRNAMVEEDPLIGAIYKPYRRLQTMSEQARYDLAPFHASDLQRARNLLESIKAVILPKLPGSPF